MEVVKDTIKSCYIHIPFCKHICSYCDFCKVFYNKSIVNKYLDLLEKEIKNNYKGEILETIYIGGGTPSVLTLKELERLFNIISIFKKSKTCEFSIECNFDSITEDKLVLFKDNGVNRLSFGIETINKDVLRKLNRTLDIEKVKSIINYSRSIGFNNINIDLMYGFSFSNMDNLKKDLDFILSLNVEHISTYSLIIEKNTKLYIDNTKTISEDIDLEMYNYIHNRLVDEDFIHYEISNFAKEGYYSSHNLVYWNNKEYYGFGVGASSYIDNKRLTNTRSITKYINGNISKNIEYLNKIDKMIYEVILGLRLKNGVDLELFYNKYKIKLEEVFDIDNLLDKSYLKINNNHLIVPFDKWYVINSILVEFLEVKNG